ncbi:hypothetical protein [Streptomyces sp. NPDC002851]
MLALRLIRGAHPLVLLRRLAVVTASGGTGFLLLCTMGYAAGHPETAPDSAVRLAWCVVPLAATVQLAVAVARTDPAARPRTGFATAGLGPIGMMALTAASTALSGVLGSMLALLVFLHLRGDLAGLPFDGAATELLGAGAALPLAGTLTLLAVVPVTVAVASAVALRPRGQGTAVAAGASGAAGSGGAAAGSEAGSDDAASAGASRSSGSPEPWESPEPPNGSAPSVPSAPPESPQSPKPPEPTDASALAESLVSSEPPAPTPAPGGLPWAVALIAVGLALETYAVQGPEGTALLTGAGLPMPGRTVSAPGTALFGLAVTALGLALAGPALTYQCGRLLQSGRPGAARLLAGRVLQEEARRIGRPLGVVCAVAAIGLTGTALYAGARPELGPLTVFGAVLVVACTGLALLAAAIEARQARAHITETLLQLGAPTTVLRGAVGLRVLALLAACAPLTWVVGWLAALPLTP